MSAGFRFPAVHVCSWLAKIPVKPWYFCHCGWIGYLVLWNHLWSIKQKLYAARFIDGEYGRLELEQWIHISWSFSESQLDWHLPYHWLVRSEMPDRFPRQLRISSSFPNLSAGHTPTCFCWSKRDEITMSIGGPCCKKSWFYRLLDWWFFGA